MKRWQAGLTALQKKSRNMVRDYLCDHYTPKKYLYRSLNSLVMRSKAALCVIPMQDHLGLDNRYRMNKPSTVGENWKWRLKKGESDGSVKSRDPWYDPQIWAFEWSITCNSFVF